MTSAAGALEDKDGVQTAEGKGVGDSGFVREGTLLQADGHIAFRIRRLEIGDGNDALVLEAEHGSDGFQGAGSAEGERWRAAF